MKGMDIVQCQYADTQRLACQSSALTREHATKFRTPVPFDSNALLSDKETIEEGIE